LNHTRGLKKGPNLALSLQHSATYPTAGNGEESLLRISSSFAEAKCDFGFPDPEQLISSAQDFHPAQQQTPENG